MEKTGSSALTALVLSSMLGAGVSSPQNMAAAASPAALLTGWAITGGDTLPAFAMLILTRIRSELDGGIFTTPAKRFGELDWLVLPRAIGCARSSPTYPIWLSFFQR